MTDTRPPLSFCASAVCAPVCPSEFSERPITTSPPILATSCRLKISSGGTWWTALTENAEAAGITLFGLRDPRQGIVHVIGPEQGISQPGMLIVCGDSHTSTHGALGALAFGIGMTEVTHVLATQTLWQRKPKTMRITLDGPLGRCVTAKDLILAVIARIGAAGATGHVIEYAGSTIRGLSMEGRLTVCNMSIEAGARAGMIAPDDVDLRISRRPALRVNHAPARSPV